MATNTYMHMECVCEELRNTATTTTWGGGSDAFATKPAYSILDDLHLDTRGSGAQSIIAKEKDMVKSRR